VRPPGETLPDDLSSTEKAAYLGLLLVLLLLIVLLFQILSLSSGYNQGSLQG
jgi:hypothetical protein